MAGGGERRDEEAVPAEYKPALFPGGESDWINRVVLSAESLSLAGSPLALSLEVGCTSSAGTYFSSLC